MNKSILLMLGFSVLTLGQSMVISSANATDPGGADNAGQNSQMTTATSSSDTLIGDFDSTTESFNNARDATGGFGLSEDVINLIPNSNSGNTAPVRRNTTGSSGDGSTSLGTGEDGSTSLGTGEDGSTSLGTGEDGSTSLGNNEDTQQTGDSTEITICASEPCTPSDGTGKAITLNDLAKLIEEDLNRSFNDLAAAERLERESAYKPRRITRRSSRRSDSCISPVGEARRRITTKLQQSQEFVEQMEKFKPENSAW